MKDLMPVNSKALEELGLKRQKSLADVLALPKKERIPADIEVVFVVDTTGSMSHFISEARTKIAETLAEIAKNVRVGVCLIEYRDHPPEESSFVIRNHGFMDRQAFESLLARIEVAGGGDAAEAVLDGLNATTSLSWTTKTRLIFLVGDAPAHGIESENTSDSWPTGCPCQLTLETLAPKVKATSAKFYAICLDDMATKSFRRIAEACGGKFTDFEDAESAVEQYIVPLLKQAASEFLLGGPN